MKKVFVLIALLLLMPSPAFAGLPSNYGAIPLDEALARSAKDGRLTMLYFTEDW